MPHLPFHNRSEGFSEALEQTMYLVEQNPHRHKADVAPKSKMNIALPFTSALTIFSLRKCITSVIKSRHFPVLAARLIQVSYHGKFSNMDYIHRNWTSSRASDALSRVPKHPTPRPTPKADFLRTHPVICSVGTHHCFCYVSK